MKIYPGYTTMNSDDRAAYCAYVDAKSGDKGRKGSLQRLAWHMLSDRSLKCKIAWEQGWAEELSIVEVLALARALGRVRAILRRHC